jgi:hypothetical protein
LCSFLQPLFYFFPLGTKYLHQHPTFKGPRFLLRLWRQTKLHVHKSKMKVIYILIFRFIRLRTVRQKILETVELHR